MSEVILKIVISPLKIEENEGFYRDILDRKNFGERLTNLVSNTNDALVISLDGKWGEGKTTFVKMWQGLLSESNIHSIYFDAFANDYVDDAFISIVSAITSYADENIEIDSKEKVEELKNKAKDVGGKFLSWTAKVGIKAATLGAIKDSEIEELKDIKNDLSKGVSEVIGNVIGEKISSHKADIALVESFRESLSEIPDKLNDADGKSLVVIIDELDRCKPTFAVEIIEKIKHLFSVENITFVLVMNKGQLEESIKSVYGSNIDSHTYLQKFITLETAIPKNRGKLYGNDYSKYVEQLLTLHNMQMWGDDKNIAGGVTVLAEYFDLSLRQLEKVFTNIALFYASSAEKSLRLTPIITFLSVIKVIDPQIFKEISNQKVSFDELCNRVGFDAIDENNREHRKLFMIKCWLKYAMLSDKDFASLDDQDLTRGFGRELWNYSTEREEIMPLFVNAISVFTTSY